MKQVQLLRIEDVVNVSRNQCNILFQQINSLDRTLYNSQLQCDISEVHTRNRFTFMNIEKLRRLFICEWLASYENFNIELIHLWIRELKFGLYSLSLFTLSLHSYHQFTMKTFNMQNVNFKLISK